MPVNVVRPARIGRRERNGSSKTSDGLPKGSRRRAQQRRAERGKQVRRTFVRCGHGGTRLRYTSKTALRTRVRGARFAAALRSAQPVIGGRASVTGHVICVTETATLGTSIAPPIACFFATSTVGSGTSLHGQAGAVESAASWLATPRPLAPIESSFAHPLQSEPDDASSAMCPSGSKHNTNPRPPTTLADAYTSKSSQTSVVRARVAFTRARILGAQRARKQRSSAPSAGGEPYRLTTWCLIRAGAPGDGQVAARCM